MGKTLVLSGAKNCFIVYASAHHACDIKIEIHNDNKVWFQPREQSIILEGKVAELQTVQMLHCSEGIFAAAWISSHQYTLFRNVSLGKSRDGMPYSLQNAVFQVMPIENH
jgi:hypothetical protein